MTKTKGNALGMHNRNSSRRTWWFRDAKRQDTRRASKVRLDGTTGVKNFLKFDGMGSCIGITTYWNGFCCATEIDGEWGADEMLVLTDVIDEVGNHPCCFNER